MRYDAFNWILILENIKYCELLVKRSFVLIPGKYFSEKLLQMRVETWPNMIRKDFPQKFKIIDVRSFSKLWVFLNTL